MPRISTGARNAACNGVVDQIDVGGGTAKLQLRTGSRPAALTDPAAGTLLAEFDLPNPCFGNAATGVATANPIPGSTGLATGTVGHFRVIDRNGGPVEDSNSVGTSGTELIVNTTNISVDDDVEITAWTVTMPAGS